MPDASGDASPSPTAEIEAREALILGKPPRIAPLAPGEISAEALAITGRLRQIGSGRPAPTSVAEVPEIVGIMLRHPELYGRQVEMAVQVAPRGAIAPRERELAILRIGWLCQAPFEWGEHVKKGREAGLTSEEIERVTQGSSSVAWSEHDRAILMAVEELFLTAMICDATWDTLAKRFDDKQLIELPILVGFYQTTAYSQNSLRVRLNGANIGLKAR